MSCRIDCGWALVVQFWVLGVGFTFGEWVWDLLRRWEARIVEVEGMAYLYTSPKTKLVSRMPLRSAHPAKRRAAQCSKKRLLLSNAFLSTATSLCHYSYPYAPAPFLAWNTTTFKEEP